MLPLVLTMAFLANGACIKAETHDNIAFESAVVDEKFVELLTTMPETLFEQYSNIIDIQTMTLSGNGRSNELVSLSGSRAGDYINKGKYICTSRTQGVVSGDFDGDCFMDNSKVISASIPFCKYIKERNKE